MSESPNPYAAPDTKVDDGLPTTAERRKRFRRRIIWTLTILGATYGAYVAATDPYLASARGGFAGFSLVTMPFSMGLFGALVGWFVSGVLWHVVKFVGKNR